MTRAAGSADALLARLTEELAPLERAVNEAWWDSNVASSPETDARRVELEQQLSDRYADAEAYADLTAALSPAPADPLVARSLDMLRRRFAAEQLPAEIRTELVRLNAECDSVYATFRGDAGGRRWNDNEIEQVLVTSDDSDERRAAWEASKQVGAEVVGRVQRLVELRNDAAGRLGWPNYYRMSLELDELSEERLFGFLDELEQVTNAPFAELKAGIDAALAARFGVDIAELMPWHYADPFFQEAPREASGVELDSVFAERDVTALTLETYSGIGLDLSSVVGRSDLYTREGKNQHAFCIAVDRGDDIRVLANVLPNERWASTMLHEFGHAAYDASIGRDLPWALRTAAHTATTEAAAMLFGRLAKDPGWLRDVARLSPAEVGEVGDAAAASLRAQMLIFARWVLVMCWFERDLYTEAGLDANARWWRYVSRFQGLRVPAGRSTQPDWAAKLHLALAPVYYQSYMLGECIASQLAGTVRERGGRLYGDVVTGEWLAEAFFRPGARERWDRLVVSATGHPLSTAAFVAEFLT
ncbi:MAG: M2 family metallopeptidase [Mycobacteriales bacterium]|nr:M2 family metallopeptidase [Frankia sp.]